MTLASHEECLSDKRKYATNFRYIEEESTVFMPLNCATYGDELIIVNPPYPPHDHDRNRCYFDLRLPFAPS
ncbi:MAG: hypothetical protein ACLU4J_01230 [Butyricimonas paravirosa]